MNFIDLRVKDIIDIILVSTLLYQTYKLLRGSNVANIFIGIITFIIIWFFVSVVFKMQLLGAILDKVISVGMLALIIIFQEEIRTFLFNLGRRNKNSFFSWIKKFFVQSPKDTLSKEAIEQVIHACKYFQKTKTGALIVIERGMDLSVYKQTGEVINAKISYRLLESIFFKNSALHDGATIISRNQIAAATCILPISSDQDIPKSLGLRHRAALGISEKVDAWVIIVSEETGKISFARNGELLLNLKPETLEQYLKEA